MRLKIASVKNNLHTLHICLIGALYETSKEKSPIMVYFLR